MKFWLVPLLLGGHVWPPENVFGVFSVLVADPNKRTPKTFKTP
jgi:hypothetical protein